MVDLRRENVVYRPYGHPEGMVVILALYPHLCAVVTELPLEGDGGGNVCLVESDICVNGSEFTKSQPMAFAAEAAGFAIAVQQPHWGLSRNRGHMNQNPRPFRQC